MSAVPHLRTSGHFDPILRPDLSEVYPARAARLRALAEGHELQGYLMLAAAIADVQAGLVDLPDAVVLAADVAHAPGWAAMLGRIVTGLGPALPEAAAKALDHLDPVTLQAAGAALVEGRFDEVDPAAAPILWAALSLEAARGARAFALPEGAAEETPDCPVCGTPPVASLILGGTALGLRYLHCALCECEWHVVRAKCSDCGDAKDLDYLSFDTPEAAIRAECCGACGGYLKVISQERDPEAEVVADDLASLVLDDAALNEGFARSGFNPFALPGA